MEINTDNNVQRTKSGVYVKFDAGLGMIAHSPYTALTYAIHASDHDRAMAWLTKRTLEAPSTEYKQTIGVGWSSSMDEAVHQKSNLLPSKKEWGILPQPQGPILINWFLTGKCPLACKYCYAEDLMRNDSLEPNQSSIENIAKTILRLNPLVVVLTGGDPLFSPYLTVATQLLAGKTGIVVDTSGYTLTDRHVEQFKRNGVSVRISLDSDRPNLNQLQRPLYGKYPALIARNVSTASAAVSAICKCLDAGLSLTIQTVATKKNTNELLPLGDKLIKLGVKSWRIFKVMPSKARYEGYKALVGSSTDAGRKITGKKARGPYEYIFAKLRDASLGRWQRMAVQIADQEVPNAVILVGPDGKFYTESNTSVEKCLIDDTNPYQPTISSIMRRVNMTAHAERYLRVSRS